MSRFLLDTNIVSSLIKERGQSRVLRKVEEIGQERICTSIIVAAEIRFGVVRKQSKRLAASAEQVLASLEQLPFEHPAEWHYAEIRCDLERRGVTIGGNDMLIAAQCMAHDLTLVTNNLREFGRIAALRVEDWLS